MRNFTLFFLLTFIFYATMINAQSTCASALEIDPCADSPTQYSPIGDDSAFNQGACDYDGDDAIWVKFTVTTQATELTITLSAWDDCSGFSCQTNMTGALYSGSCGTLNAINNCIDLTDGFFNTNNTGPWTFPVAIGETYYFRLSEEDDQGGYAELLFELDDCVEIPTPVSLKNFSGIAKEKTNMLEWETASEEDTEWHIIERSVDGRNNWKEVDRIPAAGYTTEGEDYQIIDHKPIANGYYRLLTLDFSGAKNYSDVILIERKVVKDDLNDIFPNPAQAGITIQYTTTDSESVIIAIYDMTGHEVGLKKETSQPGGNQLTYDMSQLPNGMYLVRLITPNDNFTKQVMIKR